MGRKAITKKLRFEVLKRDSFKCQYCGAAAPDTILHIDHIKPVKTGGKNTITNLITSCAPCNFGKGARELSDDSVIKKQKNQLDELQKRKEQLEMLMDWHNGLLEIDKDYIDKFCEFWLALTEDQYSLNEKGRSEIAKLIKKHGVSDVIKAARTSCEQYVVKDQDGEICKESIDKSFNKISGILRNKERPEHIQKAYYIRGILRNRVHVRKSMEWQILNEITNRYEQGASLEAIEDAAKNCSSVSMFYNMVGELV